MTDTMKVKFEFTLDDMVDAMERATGRSRTVSAWRSQQLLATSAAAFIIALLIKSGPLATKVAWAVVAALIAAVIQRYRSTSTRKAGASRLFRERFGGSGPYICEVEIGPSGLLTTQVGTQTLREWSAIQSVEDTGDAIEFIAQGLDEVVVRNRAFPSKKEWQQFLDLSRRYLALAQGKVAHSSADGLGEARIKSSKT